MKIFILTNIAENIFIEKTQISDILNNFKISLLFQNIGSIYGYFGEITQEKFKEIMPVLNGLVGKNYFYKGIYLDNTLGQNIYDFEYDDDLVNFYSKKILEISEFLKTIELLTYSKKQEFENNILLGLYSIGSFLIKTYFLMDEMIENKNDLQNIIDNENGLVEFKKQAIILDKVALDKLDLIKTRFDKLNLELSYFADILYKYFNNYIK